ERCDRVEVERVRRGLVAETTLSEACRVHTVEGAHAVGDRERLELAERRSKRFCVDAEVRPRRRVRGETRQGFPQRRARIALSIDERRRDDEEPGLGGNGEIRMRVERE